MLRLLNGAAGRREEGGIAPQMAIVVSSVALGEREMGWGKGGRVRRRKEGQMWGLMRRRDGHLEWTERKGEQNERGSGTRKK